MKTLTALFLAAAFLLAPAAHAQRLLERPELEALLAPIALYPDHVIAQLGGAAADPVRRDMLPYPELRERLAQSPYWARDLAYAYAMQQGEFWNTVQELRQRAGAYGQGPVAVYPIAPRL